MCNQTGNSAYEGYGVINLGLWGHKGFRALSVGQRLLFLYLIAGPETKPSGLFEVSQASMDDAAPHVNINDLFPLVRFSIVDAVGIRPQHLLVLIPGMYESIKDAQILRQADAQVAALPESRLREEFMRQHSMFLLPPSATLTLHAGMLEAVSSVTGKDSLQFSVDDIRRVNALSGASYTPETLLRLYSWPDSDWYKRDWRGLKGQRPTLKSIEDTIGSMSAPLPVAQRIDKEKTLQLVYRLQGSGAMSREAATAVRDISDDLWSAMTRMMPWARWSRLPVDDTKFKMYEAIKKVE